MNENCVRRKVGLPVEIVSLILDFACSWTIVSWAAKYVNAQDCTLHANPRAIDILNELDDKQIDWDSFVSNPAGWHRLVLHPVEMALHSCSLSRNRSAWDYLITHPELIDKNSIWANDMAFEWLMSQKKSIDWMNLSMNRHPLAIALLTANQDKLCWQRLHANSGAMQLLHDGWAQGKHVSWVFLSFNEHPDALTLLLKRMQSDPHCVIWAVNPNIFECTVPPQIFGELLNL